MPGSRTRRSTAAEERVELRRARPTDADVVARIWREGWADAHLGHVPDQLAAARSSASFGTRAREIVPSTIVAVRDGEVIGFVTVEADQVDQLYLDRAARGGGVGAALLSGGERAVIAAGHPRAWLAVATGNAAARRFYERQGWIDEGRFGHQAPVPGGSVEVDCHRFVSPDRRPETGSDASTR